MPRTNRLAEICFIGRPHRKIIDSECSSELLAGLIGDDQAEVEGEVVRIGAQQRLVAAGKD